MMTLTFFKQEYLLLNNSLGKFRSGKKKKTNRCLLCDRYFMLQGVVVFLYFQKRKKRKIFKLDEKNVFSKSFSIRSSTFIRISNEKIEAILR